MWNRTPKDFSSVSSLHREMPSLWSKARWAFGALTTRRLQHDNSLWWFEASPGRQNLALSCTLWYLLCHLRRPEHGTCIGFACSLLSPCTQPKSVHFLLYCVRKPTFGFPSQKLRLQSNLLLSHFCDFLWLLTFPTLTSPISLPRRMLAAIPFSAKRTPALKCSAR